MNGKMGDVGDESQFLVADQLHLRTSSVLRRGEFRIISNPLLLFSSCLEGTCEPMQDSGAHKGPFR